MPYLLFMIICTIWGSSFILMKRAVVAISPVGVGCWRVMSGGLVLLLVFFLLRHRPFVRRTDLIPLAGCVILGFAWPYSLQPMIVAQHGGAFVGMTVGFTPLLTLLLSIPLLGVYPTTRQVVGVMGALFCLGLLMWDGVQRAVPVWHLLLAFSVPLTYAVTNVWIRRSLQHVPPLELTLLCLLGCGFLLMPIAATNAPTTTVTPGQWQTAAICATALGILGTGLSTCLFTYLVQTQGPLFAGMVTNVVPIGAMCWGWSDGEQITSLQAFSVFGILAMVTLAQYGAARRTVPDETALAPEILCLADDSLLRYAEETGCEP